VWAEGSHPAPRGDSEKQSFLILPSASPRTILSPPVRELSWTHNLLIMSRCKRDEEREFYLRLCQREKWGKRELDRQLSGALFERTVLCPAKLSPVVRELYPDAATGFKDSYLVEYALSRAMSPALVAECQT